MNRVAGTLVAALIAAIVLVFLPSGWPTAAAAAVFVGFAVLAAPRLYAFAVIGITGSALLSASIATRDPAYPGIRLLDTIVDAAIAIIVGYLVWPPRRQLSAAVHLDATARAADRYLDQALLPADRRRNCSAALNDPPPTGNLAVAALMATITLEDEVDDITRLTIAWNQGNILDPTRG